MKIRKKLIITIIVFILFSFVLLTSYGYITTTILGNNLSKLNIFKSNPFTIVYSDSTNIISGDVSDSFTPGSTITKTFTITNPKTETLSFSIALDDVTNTFTRTNDITYTISLNGTVLKTDIFPTTKETIIYNQSIEPNETLNYTLTINYLNSEENQIADSGAEIGAKLTFDYSDGFDNILVYGNSIQSRLPEGYTELEYIEMNSSNPQNSFITTDVIIKDISVIKLKYKLVNTNTIGSYHPMIVSSYLSASDKNSIVPWACTDGVVSGSLSITPTTNTSSRDIVEYTITYSETSNNLLKIGGWNDYFWTAVGRYYSVKIYDNNSILIRNLIPAKNSSNVLGLYDIINDVFYTNQGTEPFTAGPEVIPAPNNPIDIKSVGDRTRNLIPYPYSISTQTLNGVTLTTQSDGSIILNGLCSLSDNFLLGTISIPEGTYTFSSNANKIPSTDENACIQLYNYSSLQMFYISNNMATTSRTQTVSGGNFEFRVRIQTGVYYDNVVYKPQLEEGSSPSSFEPYGYKIPIEISSKNLLKINGRTRGYPSDTAASNTTKRTFDFNTYIVGLAGSNWYVPNYIGNNYSINLDNSVTVKSTVSSYGIGFPIQVKPNTVYFTPVADSNITYDNIQVALYKSDGTWSRSTHFGNTTKFRTGNDETVAVVIVKPTTANVEKTVSKIFMEKSAVDDTALSPRSDYSLYSGPNTVANIYLKEPLRKIGNYSDYIDFKNKKVVRNVEVIDDTGELTLENSLSGLVTPVEETIDIPDLSTIKYNNSVTVGTNIKPSSITASKSN